MSGQKRTQDRAVHVRITGRVQGVFYRAWTRETANALCLAGWVRNHGNGTVEAVFSGPADVVVEMIEKCRQGPPGARVQSVEILAEEEALTVSCENEDKGANDRTSGLNSSAVDGDPGSAFAIKPDA